ncbi:MAG: glycosyltransferase family 4 protein [Candidatus Helarchaeota archaeon]|nr:glycosyltransferase family 4 protein [Candidatus Helarchaeota archaeon]
MTTICIIAQSHYSTDPRIRRMVRALIKAAYSVDVICLRTSFEPKRQVMDGANLYGILLDRRRSSKARYIFEYTTFTVLAAWRVLVQMIKHRYRVVQVCNIPDVLILAALLPKALGARILFDAHDCTPEALMLQQNLSTNNILVRVAILIEQIALSIANKVITASDVFRKIFVSRGANPNKISVIMNFPDHHFFPRKPDLSTRSHNGEFVLVYAGTVAPRYGLETAIRALPLLSHIQNLRLWIIGPGKHRSELFRLASDLHVQRQVIFHDPVPHDRIREIYHKSDVGICPSKAGLFGRLGFSTKVAEYMACGLPSIVSRTDTFQHFYTDSEVEFCEPDDPISFADCVQRIYQNPDYANNLVKNGLKKAKILNWEMECKRYLEIVESLANKR